MALREVLLVLAWVSYGVIGDFVNDTVHAELTDTVTFTMPAAQQSGDDCWLIWAARRASGRPMTTDTRISVGPLAYSLLRAWHNASTTVVTVQPRWKDAFTKSNAHMKLTNVSPDDSGTYVAIESCSNNSHKLLAVVKLTVSAMKVDISASATVAERYTMHNHYDSEIQSHNISVTIGHTVTMKRRGFAEQPFNDTTPAMETVIWTAMTYRDSAVGIIPARYSVDAALHMQTGEAVIALRNKNNTVLLTSHALYDGKLELNSNGTLVVGPVTVGMSGDYKNYYITMTPGRNVSRIVECAASQRLYVHPGHPAAVPADNARWTIVVGDMN